MGVDLLVGLLKAFITSPSSELCVTAEAPDLGRTGGGLEDLLSMWYGELDKGPAPALFYQS